MQNRFKWTLAALSLSLLFSCSKKTSSNDLQEAQLCLNNATASTAQSCVSNIASDTSAAANSLKCSAIFISEGFGTAVSFINAIDSINSGETCSTTCSSTLNALTTFNFRGAGVSNTTETAANITTANNAFNLCSQSGVKFYTQISSLFKIGTLASMAAYNASGVAGSTPTADEIQAQLASLPSADLGSLVLTTQSAVCTDVSSASDATKKYCTELESAIGSYTDPTQIGNCLKIKLDNPATACP
jgi:hypothetical protein